MDKLDTESASIKESIHAPAPMQPLSDVKPAPPPADDIPDGGLVAWLQVLGGFFVIFNTWWVSTYDANFA
jgi:hypothetical protein